MPKLDVVAGYFKDGEPMMYNAWATGYPEPEIDDKQDLQNIRLQRKDGVQEGGEERRREGRSEQARCM